MMNELNERKRSTSDVAACCIIICAWLPLSPLNELLPCMAALTPLMSSIDLS